MTSTVRVNQRLCNFVTTVRATDQEDLTYRIEVDSPCERVRRFAEGLEVLTLEDISDWPNSKVQRRMVEAKLGASCLAPSGIMNAARVEAGLVSKSLALEVGSISIEFVD
jgi:hypothetical protein